MARIVVLAATCLAIVGCSGNAELSKTDDKELRNNFSRALTPEEVKAMGSTKGAARPDSPQ